MSNKDLQLYKEAQGGSINAFEVLFRRYYAPLCAYAHRFTCSPDYSEELVQELFYVLWRDRVKIVIDYSVKSYLYEAVRNRALHFLGHLRVREQYGRAIRRELSWAADFPSPEADLEAKEFEGRVNEILQGLPDRRRRIFCMNRFGGNKYVEIAAKLSVSVKTVEAEMHKALIALKYGLEAG